MLASRAPAAGMEDHRQHLKPVTSYRPASSAAPSRSRSQQASKPPISKAAPCSTTAVATGTSNARQPSQSANNVPPTSVAPTKQATARPDKAKLTEQWGPPPDLIQRGQQDWLTRGHLLGEGGFARVYLSTEPDGVTTKALKVIAKEQLKSTKNKSKLFGEIKIHQAMQHPNIISFEHCFEDDDNVYMQLELCANGSLLDLLRKRRRYTEPEARFYLVQLIGACAYMHQNSVIHRDLKLGNLMLDADMNLRVGDFGLAALVKFPGERKKTICGTPNYIAPEILFDTTNGHSFEVDIWSIGVILYTLLVGKPPFQTKDVKDIYRNIKDNNYDFPSNLELSVEAVDLVRSILTPVPTARPTLLEILAHDFFTTGPFPPHITPPASREGQGPEDWSLMSIRSAHRNFEAVKRRAGITYEMEDEAHALRDLAATASSASNATIVPQQQTSASMKPRRSVPLEPVQEEAAPPASQRASARPTATDRADVRQQAVQEVEDEDAAVVAKGGMEREVKKALAPESPISDLLRSARKPLMVSPRTTASKTSKSAGASLEDHNAGSLEPRDVLQRRIVSEARSSSRRSTKPSSGSELPVEREAGRTGTSGGRENEAPSNAAATTMTSRHRRSAMTAVSAMKAPSAEAVTKGSTTKAEPISTRFPARELYDATWRQLDQALTISTTHDLESLPEPLDAAAPRVFITSWVDYTHKYGTAYSLTDGTAGLYFNDSTTMVLSPDKRHFDYISNRKGNVYSRRHYGVASGAHPEELKRKTYLLEYFDDYMAKTLTRDVAWTFVDDARTRNMDFLVKYYRMKSAIVFKMSNQVLQFNFYDHTKLLITHHGSVLTFIDGDFKLNTYTLAGLFKAALEAGYYSSSSSSKIPSQSQKERLERIRFFIDKVEYCRDVLKTLSTRKAATAAAAAAQSNGGPAR